MIIIDTLKNTPSKRGRPAAFIGSYAFIWIFALFMLVYLLRDPAACADSVRNALDICARRLIPSLFPFIAVTGIIASSGLADALGGLFGGLFERLFGIGRAGICAFLLGSVGGSPVGAIMTRDLYERGKLSLEEAERLTAFANNVGMAFCVGAIGGALYGNLAVGWLIYLCQLTAAMILGVLQRKTGQNAGVAGWRANQAANTDRSFAKRGIGEALRRFSDAVSGAAVTMLKICAFAVFFAVVGDILVSVLTIYAGRFYAVAGASLCELTLASRLAAELGGRASIPFCAFAVGFSGLSIQMQVASALSGSGISLRRFFLSKLAQGILSGGFAFLLCDFL